MKIIVQVDIPEGDYCQSDHKYSCTFLDYDEGYCILFDDTIYHDNWNIKGKNTWCSFKCNKCKEMTKL